MFEGGDPTPASARVTLLRLYPSHESQSGERPDKLPTSFATHSHGMTGGVSPSQTPRLTLSSERITPDGEAGSLIPESRSLRPALRLTE